MTKTDQFNDGAPVFEAVGTDPSQDPVTLWWMWHGDIGHWVVNRTPGAHGSDITKAPEVADNWVEKLWELDCN